MDDEQIEALFRLEKLLFKGCRPKTLQNIIWIGYWLTHLEDDHPIRARCLRSMKDKSLHRSTANFFEVLRAEEIASEYDLSLRTAHDYLAALRSLAIFVF